jgi:hypothetical protein
MIVTLSDTSCYYADIISSTEGEFCVQVPAAGAREQHVKRLYDAAGGAHSSGIHFFMSPLSIVLCQVFNVQAFLQATEKSARAFTESMLQTQMFSVYVQQKAEIAEADEPLVFFERYNAQVYHIARISNLTLMSAYVYLDSCS